MACTLFLRSAIDKRTGATYTWGKSTMTTTAKQSKRWILTASASSIALFAANAALAQDRDAQPRAYDEIVVTGAKTGETLLQRTPTAITAITADELEYSFVTELDDIQLRVPGMITGGTTGFSMPLTLRGITSRTRGVGADPAVSVYVDGVPFGRSMATAFDLFDIEQVEVLRGPQGTLWGRNSIGGAVSITTSRPSQELGAYFEGSYGNFGQQRIRASVDGPIVDDEVAAKLSFTRFERDGFQENLADDRDLNDRRSHILRGSLLLTPSDSLEINISSDWAINDTRLAFGTLTEGVVADPDVVDVDANNTLDTEQFGMSTILDYQLGDIGDFTSVTAFRKTSSDLISDSDSTGASLVEFHSEESATQFNQEFRLNGEIADRFQWLAGLHYFHETASVDWRVFVIASSPVDPVVETFAQTETNSYAAFAQTQYQLTDRLRASAGLRYTHDKKEFNFSNQATPPTRLDGDSGVLTPRITLDYQASDDVMVYASASRGYNAGGFSFTNPQDFYDPEFVWAYELGVKSTFADNRARLNLAGFYSDYTDLQVTTAQGLGVNVIQNAATAEIYGAEGELAVQLGDNFEINVSGAYTTAKFDEFIRVLPDGSSVDNSGKYLERAPKWTGSIIAAYTAPVGDLGSIRLQGEWSYIGRTFFNSDNLPLSDGGRYSLLNASVTLNFDDSRWFVSIYGKNLSNEREIDAFSVPGAGSVLVLYNAPRTYGGRVGFRY